MVEVVRRDWPERIFTPRSGKTIVDPAHYECRYLWNGKEIAWYYSKDDVLYLKTGMIAKRKSEDGILTDYERALKGDCKEAFQELFAMLNVDAKSRLSEYSYA